MRRAGALKVGQLMTPEEGFAEENMKSVLFEEELNHTTKWVNSIPQTYEQKKIQEIALESSDFLCMVKSRHMYDLSSIRKQKPHSELNRKILIELLNSNGKD